MRGIGEEESGEDTWKACELESIAEVVKDRAQGVSVAGVGVKLVEEGKGEKEEEEGC